MIPESVLLELATLGLSKDQARAVSRMLREVEDATKGEASQAIDARRKVDRDRQQRHRDSVTSRDIAGRNVTERDDPVPYKDNRADITASVDALVSNGSSFQSDPVIENKQEFIDSSLRSESIVDASADVVDLFEKPKKAKRVERSSYDVDFIQNIVAEWNDLACSLRLPQVSNITPKRQSSILARRKELIEIYEFSDGLVGFKELFLKIRGSPFLRGEPGPWRCDFDFATTQSSFTKIMEDKYEAQAKKDNKFNGQRYNHR